MQTSMMERIIKIFDSLDFNDQEDYFVETTKVARVTILTLTGMGNNENRGTVLPKVAKVSAVIAIATGGFVANFTNVNVPSQFFFSFIAEFVHRQCQPDGTWFHSYKTVCRRRYGQISWSVCPSADFFDITRGRIFSCV